MKALIFAIVTLLSLSAFSDSNKEKKDTKKDEKKELERHPRPVSVFDVIPLNSPVKESIARFLLKVPTGFEIDEVKYKVKNASRLFEKNQSHQKINLINGPQGKELHISVSKLPPGFFQLFVKVKDKKQNDHEYKNKYKDHVMFVVDESLQVPMPNEKLNDKTIAGVDSDADGIRDDIQRWINEDFADKPKVKMAMKQIAMGMQLALISAPNKIQSIIATRKVLNDMDCLNYVVGIDMQIKVRKTLESKMLNTKDRHYAKIMANDNFSGQNFTVPMAEEDEKTLCSFNPDNF